MSFDSEDDTGTVPCPHCQEPIYEQAEWCPHCEEFIPLESEGTVWEAEDPDQTTVPCPYCQEPVFEDAEYCSNCDSYISLEDTPADTAESSNNKPIWLILGVAICIGIVATWIWWG